VASGDAVGRQAGPRGRLRKEKGAVEAEVGWREEDDRGRGSCDWSYNRVTIIVF
jgi:hypothetical protein